MNAPHCYITHTYIACLALPWVFFFLAPWGGVVGGVFHCISLPCIVNFSSVSSHHLVFSVFSVPEPVPKFHVTGENDNSHTICAGNHHCTDLMFDE